MTSNGGRRLHAAGICDCCEGPPDQEELTVNRAAATDFAFVSAEDWTPDDSAAVDAPLEETHGPSVGAA